jgi:lysine 2,3-aminomutase
MEGLRGHLSGLGIPTYVVDSPHGGGKIPLMPNYLVSASDDAVVLRNFEGMLVRYQAEDRPATVRPARTRGVSSLLQGTKTALIPQGSERMARRELHVLTNGAGDPAHGSNGRHTGPEAPANGCGGNGNGHAPRGPDLLHLGTLANGCGS